MTVDAHRVVTEVAFTVNGESVTLEIEPRETLAYVLRSRLGLSGTKVSCDAQVCGACTVLVDDAPVSACTIFGFDVADRDVVTIEGLGQGEHLHPVQQAFVDHGAFQCGYCTPGQIMACVGLLKRHESPSREDVVRWLDGNTCRCTGYETIIDAALDAAREMTAKGVDDQSGDSASAR